MKKQMQIGTLPILSILLLASLPGPIFGQSSGGMSGPGGMRGSGMSGPGGMSGSGMDGGMSGPGMGGGGRSGIGMGDMGMESTEGMEFIVRPSLSYTVDNKPYRATRVRSFHYVFQSFRPKELVYADGGYGGYGGGMEDSGGYGSAMGGSGMPGMFGGYPGSPGGLAGYPGGGGYSSGSSLATNRLAIHIHAYMFDGEKTNDRTRIELMIEQPNGMGMDGMAGAGGTSGGLSGGAGMDSAGGAGDGGMGMSSGPSQMQPFSSLGIVKAKAPAKIRQGPSGATQVLSQSEIKLVTDIICQTIWKADVVKALFASKGQGDSARENETFLKQLLAEQYDTQLARQEMEAESIKRRLEQLQDELKRRKLAKDRVVEVQLGRLILDAQGLLNNER